MTTSASAPVTASTPRRNPRFPSSVPIDLTILRCGVPDNVPGRALNLCEGGMAAVVATELRRGDSVWMELQLPGIAVPLRSKAVVRHESRLRYGMEFQGLSAEQRAMIRYWARIGMDANQERILPSQSAVPGKPRELRASSKRWRASLTAMRRVVPVLFAACVLTTAAAWWHWYRGWQELESQIPARAAQDLKPVPSVPSETMQQLVMHRVEPIYPEAAREANLQGLVLVKAVVGRDGNVVDVHPVSGPDVLTQAAVDAVRWWRFQPYRVNGRPEEVETTVALEFHP